MNRIVTSTESTNYGDIVKEGDLIIDTYTKDRQVLYYKMSEAFPSLENGKTIWVDGNLLEQMTDFKLSNGADTIPWHINNLTIKPLPGTMLKADSIGMYSLCCHGLKYLTIDGGNEQKGLYNTTSRYRTGTFGIKLHNRNNAGQGFSISTIPGGKLTLRNIEMSGGFAGRIYGQVEGLTELDLENLYIHDTIDGEGLYIGSTQALPVTKFKGSIRKILIVRTGCEGLQLQHCAGLTAEDIMLKDVDTDWMNAFQPGQDTGIQFNCATGLNILRNITVDGFASIGLNLFGGDGQYAINDINNIKFYNGRGNGIYIHNSTKTNADWYLKDLAFNNMNGEYYKRTQVTGCPYIIAPNIGTDRFTWSNISTGNKSPRYVNSGFKQGELISQWHHYWMGHLQKGNQLVPTSWKKDEIVIDSKDGYGLYKCLADHITDGICPKSSQYFQKLTWDINGIRSDSEEWTNSVQSDVSPDDLRVLA